MKKYILFIALSALTMMVKAHGEDTKPFIVVIDRGHDAVDKGVEYDGENEYEILSHVVSQLVGEVQNNVKVIYHNPTGTRLTIDERAAQINALNPDLVISIHMGASKNGPRQAGILLSEENGHLEKTKKYAASLITHLTKDAYFSTIRTEMVEMALLKKVNAPALMLELGNMNAKRDRYYLQTNGAKRVALNFTAFLNDLN